MTKKLILDFRRGEQILLPHVKEGPLFLEHTFKSYEIKGMLEFRGDINWGQKNIWDNLCWAMSY